MKIIPALKRKIPAVFLICVLLAGGTACTGPAASVSESLTPQEKAAAELEWRTIRDTGDAAMAASSHMQDIRRAVTEPTAPPATETSSPKTSSVSEPSTKKPTKPKPKRPSIAETKKMSVEDLHKLNSDVFAKISLPAVGIQEPIVWTTKTTVYKGEVVMKYFRQDLYGKYEHSGTCFSSDELYADHIGFNTVVAGHNIGKRAQSYKAFGPLTFYRDEKFAKDNPYIYFDTLHGKYTFKIFSIFIDDPVIDPATNDFNYLKTVFTTQEEKDQYAEDALAKSQYKLGVDVSGSDTLITLYTCVYDFEGAKLIIMGKMTDFEAAS